MRGVAFAVVGPTLSPATSMPLPRVLVICAVPEGYLTIGYDENGRFAGDTLHESLETAKDQAREEWDEALGEWRELLDSIDPSSERGITYLLGHIDRSIPVVECEALASSLATRLASVVPAGFQVFADPPGHVTVSDGTSWVRSRTCAVINEPGDPVRATEQACLGALDDVQDFVAEWTGEPWPAPVPPLPVPEVVITTGLIELRFGRVGDFELPPLTYRDLHVLRVDTEPSREDE